jgi:hypothetical protein
VTFQAKASSYFRLPRVTRTKHDRGVVQQKEHHKPKPFNACVTDFENVSKYESSRTLLEDEKEQKHAEIL